MQQNDLLQLLIGKKINLAVRNGLKEELHQTLDRLQRHWHQQASDEKFLN